MDNQPHSRYDICSTEFDASLLANAPRTGGRFNLARPTLLRRQVFVRDIILSTRGEGAPEAVSARFLVADSQSVNFDDYRLLQNAGVPQLSLLSSSENLAVFTVPRGAKQLRHEPLHGQRSTATYIGDREIYTRAGSIYAAAWRATGKVLIDEPGASPASQLAIINFTDERGQFLYLCPPYGAGQLAATHTDARGLFIDALAANLPPSAQRHQSELLTAAAAGFDYMAATEAA